MASRYEIGCPTLLTCQTTASGRILKDVSIQKTRLRFAVALATALLPVVALGAAPQSQRPAAPAPTTSSVPAGTPLVNKILPNGLEIIVLEDHAVPIVTIELAVRNGSFTEPPELNGLSHLYEHMFFSPKLASRKGEEPPNSEGARDFVCQRRDA